MLNVFSSNAGENYNSLDHSQAIIEFSPDGTVLSANVNFLSVIGYTLKEVQGQHHSLFVEPAYRDSPEYRAFWEALRAGHYQADTFKRIAKGGRVVWIQASYNPVRNRAGRVIRIVKVATDITAQKAHDLDLASQITALHRSQAVIAFEPDGTIIDANPNFLAVVGYNLDEVRGRHHSLFVDEAERADEAYRGFWATLARGEFQSGEFHRLAQGGQAVFIQATYNPITDEAGHVVKVVKFATDVTAQVLDRQRRAKAQRAIGVDLDAIGQAVEDVTQQAADAVSMTGRVSTDIHAVAAGAEELSASVSEISQQVSNAARMAGEAVGQAQRTGDIVGGLSGQAVRGRLRSSLV